jgi:hypothetical protein
MARFERRLRKLEAQLIDRSGLVPYTQQWLDYWFSKLERIVNGEEPGEPGCIPLEAWDAIMEAGRIAELDREGPAEMTTDNGG